MKTKKEDCIKYPLKRFEPTLRTSLRIAIPTNLDRLRKHKANVEKVMKCLLEFFNLCETKKTISFKDNTA